jgi:hypothetical protein
MAAAAPRMMESLGDFKEMLRESGNDLVVYVLDVVSSRFMPVFYPLFLLLRVLQR